MIYIRTGVHSSFEAKSLYVSLRVEDFCTYFELASTRSKDFFVVKMQLHLLAALAAAGLAAAQTEFTSTAAADVARAAATARTESPASNIKGKAFDRMLTIYLETTDFNTVEDRKAAPLPR